MELLAGLMQVLAQTLQIYSLILIVRCCSAGSRIWIGETRFSPR